MAKKVVLALLFAALIGGGVFAQSNAPNTITVGSMLAYERTLTPKFAIGAEASLDFFGLPTVYIKGEKVPGSDFVALLPLAFDAFARLYPWEGKFFTHLSLGFQTAIVTQYVTDDLTAAGFHAKLQAGWKIDIGQPAKWILEARLGPGMSVGAVTGEMTFGGTAKDLSYFMLTFPVQVGIGYSF